MSSGSRETRIAKLERKAAAANPAHSGVMTPEEYAALERGELIWPALLSGGVFIMSGVMTPEEWAAAAKAQQEALIASNETRAPCTGE